MAGSLRRDIVGLLVAHYARPHTEILTVPVIHVIAQRLDDLSGMLASVGRRADVADIYRVSRADIARNPTAPDPRDRQQRPLGRDARDIYIPDLRLGSGIIPGQPTEGIKIKPRDFR